MSFRCANGNPAQVRSCTRWGCSSDLRPCPTKTKQTYFSRSTKSADCRQRDSVQAYNKAQSQSQPSLVSSAHLAAAAAAAIVAFSSPALAEIQARILHAFWHRMAFMQLQAGHLCCRQLRLVKLRSMPSLYRNRQSIKGLCGSYLEEALLPYLAQPCY